jgi:Putative peptidoglycan binding domain
MPQHTVIKGDDIASIAKQYGFADWRKIWDFAANAALRQQRPNPDQLKVDDVVAIPETDERTESVPTDASHKFRYGAPPTKFKIRLWDVDDQPMANIRYRLTVAGQEHSGETDAQGNLVEVIPADARDGELTYWLTETDAVTWTVGFGELPPWQDLAGVQARLNNLGYGAGEVNGEANETTEAAIRAFQEKNQLTVTGTDDARTRAKLHELHDQE